VTPFLPTLVKTESSIPTRLNRSGFTPPHWWARVESYLHIHFMLNN
jgi:hypothetical protein